MAQIIKNLPAIQETRVRFLGQEDPLEKEVFLLSLKVLKQVLLGLATRDAVSTKEVQI